MDPINVNEASETKMRVAWKARSGSFFFLAGNDHRRLRELADTAGIDVRRNERLEADDPASEIADGPWGPVWATTRTTQFALHRCFEIYFSQRELIASVGEFDPNREYPLEEDPYWPIAQVFRDACERLRPEVAFMIQSFITNVEMVNEEIYPNILDYMPESLIGFPYDLLYIGPDRASIWDPSTPLQRLTEIPVNEGKLFFERYRPFHIEELTSAMGWLQDQIDSGQLSDDESDRHQ